MQNLPTEEQLNLMLTQFKKNVNEMYDILENNPNVSLKTIEIIVIDDENDERTELVRSEATHEKGEFVRRDYYRMYITYLNARTYNVFYFEKDERTKTTTRFEVLCFNDNDRIVNTRQLQSELFRWMFLYPDFQQNNMSLFNDLIVKLWCVRENTLNYEHAPSGFEQSIR
jgi:hypothetical protein